MPSSDERKGLFKLVAQGTEGTIGEPGKCEFSKAIFDGSDLKTLESVHEQEIVGHISKSIPSTPRTTIFGTKVAMEEDDASKLEILPAYFTVSQDGFIASKFNGHLCRNAQHKILVGSKVEIKGNVLGQNILVDHDVCIFGDLENSTVECNNLEVKGVIRQCRVQSTGHVTVEKGIHGGQDGGNIRSEKNLRSSYINSAHVVVKGKVNVTSSIFASTVFAGDLEAESAKVTESKLIIERKCSIKEVGTELSKGVSSLWAGMDERAYEVYKIKQEMIQMQAALTDKIKRRVLKPEERVLAENEIEVLRKDCEQFPGTFFEDGCIEIKSIIKQGTLVGVKGVAKEVPMDIESRVRITCPLAELIISRVKA